MQETIENLQVVLARALEAHYANGVHQDSLKRAELIANKLKSLTNELAKLKPTDADPKKE